MEISSVFYIFIFNLLKINRILEGSNLWGTAFENQGVSPFEKKCSGDGVGLGGGIPKGILFIAFFKIIFGIFDFSPLLTFQNRKKNFL